MSNSNSSSVQQPPSYGQEVVGKRCRVSIKGQEESLGPFFVTGTITQYKFETTTLVEEAPIRIHRHCIQVDGFEKWFDDLGLEVQQGRIQWLVEEQGGYEDGHGLPRAVAAPPALPQPPHSTSIKDDNDDHQHPIVARTEMTVVQDRTEEETGVDPLTWKVLEIVLFLRKGPFLSTRELGRLLLFTSKELTTQLFPKEDKMWKFLLECWGALGDSAVAQATPFWTPEQCFRALRTQPKNIAHNFVPRELQYTPEDYKIVIAVFNENPHSLLYDFYRRPLRLYRPPPTLHDGRSGCRRSRLFRARNYELQFGRILPHTDRADIRTLGKNC